MDPSFYSICSHSMARLTFRLFYLVKNVIFRKDLESPLIFVLFLKRKQNKKENLKCDYLFGKNSLWKTKVESEGQVTYWEVTVVSRSIPLSRVVVEPPKNIRMNAYNEKTICVPCEDTKHRVSNNMTETRVMS